MSSFAISTPAAVPPGEGAEMRRPDGGPLRVLVVDDEQTLAELLTMALRYEGWDVRSAGTGLAAVRSVREFRPDAVVLDVMLPDIDGLEVLRRLRGAAPAGARLALVLSSPPRPPPGGAPASPAGPPGATTPSPRPPAWRGSPPACEA